MPFKRGRGVGLGTLGLVLGATAIGLAPILVRLSETGPVATAFHRIILAQPFLWLILIREPKDAAPSESSRRPYWMAALAGACFAADLSIWHWSIHLTTIANSTLFANFAPVFVVVGARLFLGERISGGLVVGLLLALSGGFLLIAESLKLDPQYLAGDLLAILAAVFYAIYLLAVKSLRKTKSAWFVMSWTGVFSAPILFAVALVSGEAIVPHTLFAWTILILLAMVSHFSGQGLIAYGLAHVTASVSAVILMWQPVVAALLAWWILHEALTPLRIVGGLIVIAGILAATWPRNAGMRIK